MKERYLSLYAPPVHTVRSEKGCRSMPGCQQTWRSLPAHREAKQAEQVLGSEVAGLEREIQFRTAELQGKGPEKMALCSYS